LATRRVELDAVREGHEPDTQNQRITRENLKILSGIKQFFGL
jgi:hypothetical protein